VSCRHSAHYAVADVFAATSASQGFVVLVRFILQSPVTVTHLSLMIVWPDSGFCVAGVMVVPSNAAGAMSHGPVFHFGPDDVDAYPLLYAPSDDLLLYGLFLVWILLLRVVVLLFYLHVLFCVWRLWRLGMILFPSLFVTTFRPDSILYNASSSCVVP
jgi:hypothetical protein